jgi:2',3'-cyclic-nucleotide 2'-phosphodiesterase / 3'-nucleotidase
VTPTLGQVPCAVDDVDLRIVETTDLHMHLFPYDYYSARRSVTHGLAHAAGLIAQLRAASPNLLLFDNGDFLQGSPLGDYAASARRIGSADLHPAIAAMNRMRYDAVTLGNHEFNYGLGFLEHALSGADFPVVTANVLHASGANPRRDRTLLPPYVLLDRVLLDRAGRSHRLRVGVIGLVPPQTAIWDRAHLEGRVMLRDMVETAAAWVPEMREAGADLVVALAHTGIGPANASEGMENAAIPLAGLDGIDVLLAGHAHLVFPSPRYAGHPGVDVAAGTIQGKPAVMAGCYGSHLGIIDLRLRREGGRWRMVTSKSEARALAERRPNGTLRARAPSQTGILSESRALHAATRRFMAVVVGKSAERLCSHFALVSDTAALRVIGAAVIEHVAGALKDGPHAGLPVLAAVAPFKAGGRGGPANFTDIPPGPLARRNVADLYSFTNTLRAVRVTGAGLHDWLERSAALYRPWQPGNGEDFLIDPDFPSYNFDMILGLTYRIAPDRPARFDVAGNALSSKAGRILDLRYQGRPVGAEDVFIVATNSYRIATWQADPGFPGPHVILATDESVRDILSRWIAAQDGPVPLPPPGWSLALPPGAAVLFDTSATADPASLSPLKATRLGPAPGGFARFRLSA